MPHENSTQVELPKLPVVEAMERLRSALAQGHAVLTAEPGSGKTTLTPLLLLDEPWLRQRKILMLEPRRPAARMAARRMAQLLGERVGQTVGYQIRFERRISAATRIEVLTEGLLLRRLQADPELPGVGLVIFDEFHERNLQGDLSLALSLDVVAELREDLRLLVMSASLDAGPLVDLMPAQAVERKLATMRIRWGGFPYHLALLQLEHDSSFQMHSPFSTMPAAASIRSRWIMRTAMATCVTRCRPVCASWLSRCGKPPPTCWSFCLAAARSSACATKSPANGRIRSRR